MPRLSYSTGLFSFFIHGGKNGRLADYMRMHYLWLALVLGLIPGTLNAGQVINGVPVEPVGVGRATYTSTGNVIQPVTFKATPPGANAPSYYQRAVTYGKATVGGNIKQFAKFSAYSLAFSAIIHGVGMFYDYATGDIYPNQESAGTPATTCNPRIMVSTSMGGTTYGCSLSSALSAHTMQCNSINAGSAFAPGYCVLPSVSGYGTFNGAYYFSQRFNSQVMQGTVTVQQQAQSYNQPAIAGTPATNEQVADAVAPALDPDTLDKLATHPDTGAVKETQEVLNTATQLANELAKLANPNAPTVSAPTASPTVNTTDTPQQPGMDMPPACIWFKPVCDFIDWFKPDPTPDDNAGWTVAHMITQDELEVQSYSSGLGSGSCPADESFSVYGVSLSYSYTPICDLAGTARIFTILSAYLLSIFIVLGIRR